MHIDTLLRHHIYDHTSRRGVPPTIVELTAATISPESNIRESLQRVEAARIVVLQPSTGEILMAPPFSAVPTSFLVHTSRFSTYANCAWDALGVPIMLRERDRIVSSCGCCGDAITLDAGPDDPPSTGDVIHFAVPAGRWWQDIVFT
jgi:Alkylmercury lyase